MHWALTPTKHNAPLVQVSASWADTVLALHFQIVSQTPYDWAIFDPKNAQHTDFLWENDCLECFIGIDESAYFEVNASPNGAFALYQFDGYRTPAHLPPKATQAIDFKWKKIELNQSIDGQFCSNFCFEIYLPNPFILRQLNPTAILSHNDEATYYAIRHANPPDFHQRACWVTIQSQT